MSDSEVNDPGFSLRVTATIAVLVTHWFDLTEIVEFQNLENTSELPTWPAKYDFSAFAQV
jgi:hypothetical protein